MMRIGQIIKPEPGTLRWWLFVSILVAVLSVPITKLTNNILDLISAPAALEQAKAVISKRLVDPDSAKFEKLQFRQGKFVCGIVSAKDKVGVNSGPTPFIFLPYDNFSLMGGNFDILADDSALDRAGGRRTIERYCAP